MNGRILVEDHQENASIEAETLYWNNEEKKLTSEEEEKISIEVEDKGSITGTGFSADLMKKGLFPVN